MPPLPQNDTSYPPSSSGYQPLSRTSEEDLESRSYPLSSSFTGRIKRRRFTASPTSAVANDPTDLLRSFLSDTRSNSGPRQLSLRISISNRGVKGKTVEVPLPELTEQDSLPYALADDVPCLRGLPVTGALTFGKKLKGLVGLLTNRTPSSTLDISNAGEGEGLQVYNTSQKRTLYASQDEIERYHQRLAQGSLPPWTPLNSTTPAPHTQQQEEEEPEEEQEPNGSGGDFDLGSVFTRSRKRRTTRLVSIGLQEAFERFSDDRHFSKHLVCRRHVWGWNLTHLRISILTLLTESKAASAGKGKSKALDTEEQEIKIEVAGMDDGPVYQVVWAPIPFLSQRASWMFELHGSLLTISLLSGLFVGSVLLRLVANTLLLIAGLLGLLGWGGMMYLIRTQGGCVYDTVGTVYSLTPRWVRIADADPAWDHDRVLASLKAQYGDKMPRIEQRGDEKAWFIQRGMDQNEWLSLHRERISHLLSQ